MKYLNFILAILFVLFAYVQLNDPDAFLWGSIYLFIALLLSSAGFSKYFKSIYQISIAILVIWGTVLLPTVYNTFVTYDPNLETDPTVTHTSDIQTEIFKEFGGILISLFALFFLLWQNTNLLKKKI